MRVRKFLALTATAAVMALGLSACSSNDSYLFELQRGHSAHIASTDENGEAVVEQKKDSGLWVIPIEALYMPKASADYPVEVELTKDGVWIVDPHNAKVGVDHDDCLAPGEEVYAQIKKGVELKFEPEKQDDGANDDCTAEPEA